MAIELPDVVTVEAYGYDSLRGDIRAGRLERLRPGAYLSATPTAEASWKQRRRRILARCVAVAEKLTTPFAFADVTVVASSFFYTR